MRFILVRSMWYTTALLILISILSLVLTILDGSYKTSPYLLPMFITSTVLLVRIMETGLEPLLYKETIRQLESMK